MTNREVLICKICGGHVVEKQTDDGCNMRTIHYRCTKCGNWTMETFDKDLMKKVKRREK